MNPDRKPLRKEREHDATFLWHSVSAGSSIKVIRVLHGTDVTDWSGTAAYRKGIDLLLSLHCDSCCGVVNHHDCPTAPAPTLRLDFTGIKRASWFEEALGIAQEHQRHAHGLAYRDWDFTENADATSCECQKSRNRKPPQWTPLPHPHSRECRDCRRVFSQPGSTNEILCPDCKESWITRLAQDGFEF